MVVNINYEGIWNFLYVLKSIVYLFLLIPREETSKGAPLHGPSLTYHSIGIPLGDKRTTMLSKRSSCKISAHSPIWDPIDMYSKCCFKFFFASAHSPLFITCLNRNTIDDESSMLGTNTSWIPKSGQFLNENPIDQSPSMPLFSYSTRKI